MGKKDHPPRNAGPQKKSAPAKSTNNNENKEGPNIIFTNAKDDPKPGKKKGNSSSNQQKDADLAAAGEAPKKPDTRTLVSGSTSWTGKLPLNLLSEHCQKQKWERPEYTIHKSPGGFTCSVIFRHKNPKTQEVTQLPAFSLPPDMRHVGARETAVEARHFAAAFALFRVASGRNLSMAMPPQFRDLWKGEFKELKEKDSLEGKQWMYAADPFQAYREKEDAKAQRAKTREKIEKEKAAKAAQPGSTGSQAGQQRDMRGWKTAPKIEMGKNARREVESTVKNMGVWNSNNVDLPIELRRIIADKLTDLGFRRSHIEEATDICKDEEEVLEWLLIHVPEDDLPRWSLPEGYTAGITMASGNLKRDAAVKRLASSGYATELCEEAFEECEGDERLASQNLQDKLLQDDTDLSHLLAQQSTINETTGQVDMWEEELAVLDSIFARRFKALSNDACEIEIDDVVANQRIAIVLRRPQGRYPHVPPVLNVTGTLPAYIRLSITKKALAYAANSLLGDQMIFNLVDWLEIQIPNILEHPGRLSEISGASNAGPSINILFRAHRVNQAKRHPRPLDIRAGTESSRKILGEWDARQDSPKQQEMNIARQMLPAWSLQAAVVSAVRAHQVVIISGETGSGKSTQCVQFVLDDMIRRQLGAATSIVCTQPRRISALGLADRVAEERCSTVGQEVGYSIRGESKIGSATKLNFCTTGVLLRRLQISGESTEDVVSSLANVSHVFVDEVHERSLDTDFLLALLRDVLRQRKDLRVILMSATLDADIFSSYFGGPGVVGKVEIQGRAHPVQDYFLDDVVRLINFNKDKAPEPEAQEDPNTDPSVSKSILSLGIGISYNLIAALVNHISTSLPTSSGGILIFLPGTLEITRCLDQLRTIPKLHPLPLHASLLPQEQRRVFLPPPGGKRKVIAATNVAETSITIPDIVAVIDTGRVKETRYDATTQMVKLEEVWASRAACKQRRGRAGRVTEGKCYKLFTRAVEQGKMPERPEPEIRRTPLEQLCLAVKAMGAHDVAAFLAGTISPPEDVAVEGAVSLLRRVGAIDGDSLTALGRTLALIPADLRCAKLMIYGALFGCLDSCATMAAILTLKSPFVAPLEKREEARAAREAFGTAIGDAMVDLRAFGAWSDLKTQGLPAGDIRAWCVRNFLSPQTLNDIAATRSQYLATLAEIGFPATPNTATPRKPDSTILLQTILLSALYPNILRVTYPPTKYTPTATGTLSLDPSAREIKLFDAASARVFIHPSSTLFPCQAYTSAAGSDGAPFMSYAEKVSTSKVFARGCCPCGVLGGVLFGGLVEVDKQGRGLCVDDTFRVRGWARVGVLLARLKAVLDAVLGRWVEGGLADGDERVLEVVRRLVERDGLDG